MKNNRRKILIVALLIIAPILCCCCILGNIIISYTMFRPVQIEGESMKPNYKNGEIYLIQIQKEEINRGDVIVFQKPGQVPLIKRVIALPLDKFKIEKNEVYVNNLKVNESYLSSGTTTSAGDFFKEGESVLVPVDKYVLLGDNRSESLDSRYIGVGFVEKEWIIGKVKSKLF